MTPIHQRLIDSTLLIVNARTLELVVWTKFPVREDAQHEERIRDRLRQSKLGYDLADLADYAEGEERVSTERARQIEERALKRLSQRPELIALREAA